MSVGAQRQVYRRRTRRRRSFPSLFRQVHRITTVFFSVVLALFLTTRRASSSFTVPYSNSSGCRRHHPSWKLYPSFLSPSSRWKATTSRSNSSEDDDDDDSSAMIYGIPGSGWTSPTWNWGYGVGTGHDCAAICRQIYSDKTKRVELVNALLLSGNNNDDDDDDDTDDGINFEEVKLILGLAWQNGRWTGADGGEGGYGEVLEWMAQAQRYEGGQSEKKDQVFIRDMAVRYPLLRPTPTQLERMEDCLQQSTTITTTQDAANLKQLKQICAGLVLEAMGFVESGL